MSVHVIQRGNNRLRIFTEPPDCKLFLASVRRITEKCGVAVHAIVLMSTHTHMLVTPSEKESLPDAAQQLFSGYSRHYNREYGRIGTLWNERYRGINVNSERYWLQCLSYIELNPVRAGIVANPGDYPWSSYRVHAFGESNELFDWLTPHPLYLQLGKTSPTRQSAYRAICNIPLTDDELRLQRRPPKLTVKADLAVA